MAAIALPICYSLYYSILLIQAYGDPSFYNILVYMDQFLSKIVQTYK